MKKVFLFLCISFGSIGYAQELNIRKAITLANQGISEAQSFLGSCYENGENVEQSFEKAVYWYTKAANQGDTNAQLALGNCYLEGKGVNNLIRSC